jgi:hypothetical protein
MDRLQMAADLTQTEKRVIQGERHIRGQRKIIHRLERDGYDTASAKSLLRLFLESQELRTAHRARRHLAFIGSAD